MSETLKTFLIALLTGNVCAAFLNLIGGFIIWKKRKKIEKREQEEKEADQNDKEWRKEVDRKIDAVCVSQKFVLYDRIRYLALAYIAEGEIDFDDRRILNDMHHAYHDGLGGNGDLNTLMGSVNKLPLKINK